MDAALNVTITREEPNAWYAIKRSWWFPTWMTISVVWALSNMIVSIVLLTLMPRQRTLAFVVLCFEVASNFMRLPFFLDPFIMWLLPQPVINVFYSMHWPIHLATAIIVLFFWIELTSKTNVNASGGFLTSGKAPAAIAISIVIIVEFATSAIRAAIGPLLGLFYVTAYAETNHLHSGAPGGGKSDQTLFIFFSAVYVSMLLALAISYFYVFNQVRQFFMSSPKMNAKLSLLRRVSIRLLGTAISFLVMIVWGILSSTALYFTAVGQSVVQFLIFATINAGSTLTISAFVESILRKRREFTKTSTSGGEKSSSFREESVTVASMNP